MKKKFAFFLMGKEFDPASDRAVFETGSCISYVYTVRNLEHAKKLAAQCAQDGVGVIELCGAFGSEGAAQIRESAGAGVGIGYVIHDADQDDLFRAFFA